MLAASGKSQHGWVEGAGCGQDGDSIFLRERYYDALYRPTYGPFRSTLAEKKRNLQQMSLLNTTELCSHSVPSELPFGPQSYRKAAIKSRPLKCSLFWMWNWIVYSCTIVCMIKSNGRGKTNFHTNMKCTCQNYCSKLNTVHNQNALKCNFLVFFLADYLQFTKVRSNKAATYSTLMQQSGNPYSTSALTKQSFSSIIFSTIG